MTSVYSGVSSPHSLTGSKGLVHLVKADRDLDLESCIENDVVQLNMTLYSFSDVFVGFNYDI